MSSIIQRSILQLGQKFLKDVNYIDIDYRGYISASADPTLHSGQVLVNDLKLWVQSNKGDYYRRFTMGGFFDNIQKYPLDTEGAMALSSDLTAGINANFPSIVILSLQVIPNFQTRIWTVTLAVRDTITGAIAPATMNIPAV